MYTDIITKIKNAQAARKKNLKVPYNEIDLRVAELLARKGFLRSAERKGKGYKRIIAIVLNDSDGHILGTKFMSKSSRRIYSGYKMLRPVHQGFGFSVLSTSKGLMTGDEAKKNKVGGELLFEIW